MHLLSATAGLVRVNGVSYGLLLFMLSSGLTLIFSMLGVLNFAHASFYMLGAYFAYALSARIGFWAALIAAPLLVGAVGALFERSVLRRKGLRVASAAGDAPRGARFERAGVRGPVDAHGAAREDDEARAREVVRELMRPVLRVHQRIA